MSGKMIYSTRGKKKYEMLMEGRWLNSRTVWTLLNSKAGSLPNRNSRLKKELKTKKDNYIGVKGVTDEAKSRKDK